ncbi:MAG: hypothetical protein HY747_10925 [Elusimicrobia bacterium]|nr:hypothetical protein [Elusimicrobiota bacterium]
MNVAVVCFPVLILILSLKTPRPASAEEDQQPQQCACTGPVCAQALRQRSPQNPFAEVVGKKEWAFFLNDNDMSIPGGGEPSYGMTQSITNPACPQDRVRSAYDIPPKFCHMLQGQELENALADPYLGGGPEIVECFDVNEDEVPVLANCRDMPGDCELARSQDAEQAPSQAQWTCELLPPETKDVDEPNIMCTNNQTGAPEFVICRPEVNSNPELCRLAKDQHPDVCQADPSDPLCGNTNQTASESPGPPAPDAPASDDSGPYSTPAPGSSESTPSAGSDSISGPSLDSGGTAPPILASLPGQNPGMSLAANWDGAGPGSGQLPVLDVAGGYTADLEKSEMPEISNLEKRVTQARDNENDQMKVNTPPAGIQKQMAAPVSKNKSASALSQLQNSLDRYMACFDENDPSRLSGESAIGCIFLLMQ